MSFIDISIAKNCKNKQETYGEICVKCNKCGRFNTIIKETYVKIPNNATNFDVAKKISRVQEPCEDCISRQAVKELYYKDGYIDFRKICELQSVNPQPKTGHWIKIKPYPLQIHDYECSECGYETDDNAEKYCSDCGAKMEVRE